MTPPAPPAARLLGNRDYVRFWSARFLSTVGVQIESVTLGWQVYAVARRTQSVEQSAFLVGMLGLAQFLPLFALTFLAGETADRRERKRIVLTCSAIEVVVAATLAVIAHGPPPPLAALFIAAAVFGAARAFLSPALGAMGPMLVPPPLLPKAIAWNSLAWQGGAVVGPWIGGLLCALDPFYGYVAAALLYAGSALSMSGVRTDTRPAAQPGSRLELIREGIGYVWRNKIVLGAISLDLFAVLLGGATALLPVFARDVLSVGAHGFGVLRSGPAIGAGLSALVLARRPIHRHAGAWMFAGVAVFGAATIVFAVSRTLWMSVAALAVLGAADMISVYVRQTLVQVVTPDPMRGRVSAVSGLFIGASNELGEFESGVVARGLGPVGAALFGGVGALVVTVVWARLFPTLRKADGLT